MAKSAPSSSSSTTEKRIKDEELDETMAKMMIQMQLLTKNVMDVDPKSVNVLATKGNWDSEDDVFDNMYNEKVKLWTNQVRGVVLDLPFKGKVGIKVGTKRGMMIGGIRKEMVISIIVIENDMIKIVVGGIETTREIIIFLLMIGLNPKNSPPAPKSVKSKTLLLEFIIRSKV